MPTPALAFRLVLALACGLLLAGGVVGAMTVDDEATATRPATAAIPSTPDGAGATNLDRPAADAAEASVVDGQPPVTTTTTTTAAAAAGQATTGRVPTTTGSRPSASGAPGPLVAPKVGSYPYDATTSSGGGAPSTTRVNVTVEAAGSEGATTLQDISIPTDQVGQRATVRSRVAWGAAGAIVRRSQVSGADCVWQPAWPQYAGGLKAARAWTFDTRCSVTAPVQATVERRGSRSVSGSQMVELAGRQVATWTITVDETTVITTALGVLTFRSVGTEQLAPSLGVPLTKTESLSGTGVEPNTTSIQKLISLP